MFRYRHYLAHIVVQKRLFATVVPLNGHTRPVSFRDRASIHFVIAPANAVADFKVSRLIAGHLFTCLFPVGTYARICPDRPLRNSTPRPRRRHQKPNPPAIAAIGACHQNNLGRAAFIERKLENSSDEYAVILLEVAVAFGDLHQIRMCHIPT